MDMELMTELMLDVGQANEFKLACRRAGYTNADIKKLCEGDILAQFLSVLKGHANIVMAKHIIDCDADPYVPDGWEVEEHTKGGQFEFEFQKIILYINNVQQNGHVIVGNKFRENLKGKSVLNANVLDFLLAHPDLIPHGWKDKHVFFWGTIYRGSDGRLYVRCLGWDDCRWGWNDYWLGGGFDACDTCASLASS